MSKRPTQTERLRRFFEARAGQWVDLPDILALGIAQFGARIKELRDEHGMDIENETEHYCECGHASSRHYADEPFGVAVCQKDGIDGCGCRHFRNAMVKSRYRYTPRAKQQTLFQDVA